VWRGVCKHFIALGFPPNTSSFIPFSSRKNWDRFRPVYPLQPDPIRYIPPDEENQSSLPTVTAPAISRSPLCPTTGDGLVQPDQQRPAVQQQTNDASAPAGTAPAAAAST
jgi:hypothetical protein